MAEPPLNLGNIQGNILGGFKQDYQTFLFFQILDAGKGRAWLAETVGNIASSKKVQASNEGFKRAAKRLSDPTSVTRAIWVNVAFTHKGLAALGVPQADLNTFPEEFRDGMRARAGLLGDVDESAPERWIEPLRNRDIHGILLVAADRSEDCEREVSHHKQRLAKFGLKLLYIQTGMVRQDDPGHEHFGFKDGISQPGILGVTPRNNPKHPTQGDPGQDLIQPGEFVLGHPTQQSPAAVPTLAWAKDGSYLVFRRLRQDVQGFHDFVRQQAVTEKITPDLMGAKLVGRYKSGAPLEGARDQPEDPGQRDPKILNSARINNFEYGGDPDGRFVPRAAHIRKAYPRDEDPPGETNTQTHRLLRRGIPFGESLQERAPPGSPRSADADRGLLFLCYQSSIADQFECVQRRMVNNPGFPRPGDGQDPIISQDVGERTFTLPGGVQDHVTLIKRWVTTTGGDYFFSPSISALRELSAEHKRERRTAVPYNSEYMKAFAKFVVAVWDKRDPAAAFEGIVTGQETPQELVNLAAQKAQDIVSTEVAGKADTQRNEASAAWKKALAAFDIDPRPGRTVVVHQNTRNEFHYVIPESPTSNPALTVDIAIRGLETLECDQ